MEADDDAIVVIVGDGEDEENGNFLVPIKQEVFDDDEVEKLIETAEVYGEFVQVRVKEEFDEDKQSDADDDDEYVPDDDSEDDDCGDDDDNDDGSGNEEENRRRNKMLEPSQRKSFVKELTDQYPELKHDKDALTTTMSEIMRNIKPPPLPQDYFIMNGIMFECVECGYISDKQPAVGRHYQEKHGERYLVCFACGVDFRSTTNLYKHEKRCTAPDAAVMLKARALMLGRKGRSRPYVPKHLLPEDEPKKPTPRKFFCTLCPASFTAKTCLRSHEMLHRGERPYSCPVCPRSYTSHGALSRHRKKHGDEQFICDHCGRVFKVKAALVTHIDTHRPVKRFGCDKCERRYATKAAMTRHQRRVHLGLLPHCVCKICHKRYPLMSILKEHTRKAHGLLLMTRKMFFQTLPTLTDTQREQAMVVLRSELEADSSMPSMRSPSPELNESTVEVANDEDYESDQKYDESPQQEYEDCKDEVGSGDDSANQQIVLSEEVLQYVQSIQDELAEGTSYQVVVMD